MSKHDAETTITVHRGDETFDVIVGGAYERADRSVGLAAGCILERAVRADNPSIEVELTEAELETASEALLAAWQDEQEALYEDEMERRAEAAAERDDDD